MEYCCDELKKFVEKGNALVLNDKVFIYGMPSFANDGDGHFDDMTDFFEIKYCPFCGNAQHRAHLTLGDFAK